MKYFVTFHLPASFKPNVKCQPSFNNIFHPFIT